MSPDQHPSLDEQMAEALRLQREHVAASRAVNRSGWTRQQWVDDARKQMGDLHGSILDLVNGHVVNLIKEIDYLREQIPSDSPAAAPALSQPETSAGEPKPDWHRIAVQIARYGGSYHGLKTWERDMLEDEVQAENEREWGVDWERRTDAASGGECA